MNPTELRTELENVLARYPAMARPSAEPEPLGNAGGLSGAWLWRFPSGRGPLVARAWPPEGPPRAALQTIHRWIAQAGRIGFLAVPLAARDGRTIQEVAGRLWEVGPWLPGRPPRPGPADAIELRAAFTALGALHQALRAETIFRPSSGLRERVSTFEWWITEGFPRLDSTLRRAAPDPAVALAHEWLAGARRAAPAWLSEIRDAAGISIWCQPCLRDVRPEHFLLANARVTGLVDYGAMGVDSVAGDLARLLAEWIGMDRALRGEALDAYAAIRPLTEEETLLIDAFERSGALLGAGRWASWYFLESRVFREPDAVVQGLRKGVDRLAQRLMAESR